MHRTDGQRDLLEGTLPRRMNIPARPPDTIVTSAPILPLDLPRAVGTTVRNDPGSKFTNARTCPWIRPLVVIADRPPPQDVCLAIGGRRLGDTWANVVWTVGQSTIHRATSPIGVPNVP